MVGKGTVITDNPILTPRKWDGRVPLRIVADRANSIPKDSHLLNDGNPTIILGPASDGNIQSYMKQLYSKGITSVLVEGGAKLLQAFIDEGMWDIARVEIAPIILGSGVKSPELRQIPQRMLTIQGNQLFYYINNAD